MQRIEIIEGIKEIVDAIAVSGIDKRLAQLTKARDSEEAVKNALDGLQSYYTHSSAFNPSAQRIEMILGLNELKDTAFWLLVTTKNAGEKTIHEIDRVYDSLVFSRIQLPKILSLLQREFTDLKDSSPIMSNGKEMKILTVTVFEDDKVFSKPQRLVNVLDSVDKFYSACALLSDESPDTLSVVGLDSGRDKSIDFLGTAKVIDCVTTLIGQLWDNAVFFRERKFDVRLDLISKTLPIYKRINELERNGNLEAEKAENLKKNIFDGANRFVESGASIPQIEAHSTYNSRSLLPPVQKLIVSAPGESQMVFEADSTSEIDDLESNQKTEKADVINLSADEQKQFSELLQKIKDTPGAKMDEDEDVLETNGK